MTDSALRNAEARRDALLSRISPLKQELEAAEAEFAKIVAWIEMWHAFNHGQNVAFEASNVETGRPTTHSRSGDEAVDGEKLERTRTTGNPKKEVVAAEALKIIEEAGKPVSRADLHKELAARGILIEGKDPEQVLSTMLWRTRDSFPIVRMSSGGYGIAGHVYDIDGTDPSESGEFAKTAGIPSYEDVEAAMIDVVSHYSDQDAASISAQYDFGETIPLNIVEKISSRLGYRGNDLMKEHDGKALAETFEDILDRKLGRVKRHRFEADAS